RKPSPVPIVILAVLAVATVVVIAVGQALSACVLAVLSTFFLEWAIDERFSKPCPHCGLKSLRLVGSGAIWYVKSGDLREQRVFWGECFSCGKSSVRRGGLFAQWAAYPEGQENVQPRA